MCDVTLVLRGIWVLRRAAWGAARPPPSVIQDARSGAIVGEGPSYEGAAAGPYTKPDPGRLYHVTKSLKPVRLV